MTGEDPMEEYRGQYTDEESSKTALKEIGKGSLYGSFMAKFGRPVKPGLASRGDIMLHDTTNGPTMLICMGEYSIGPGVDGVKRLPRLDAKYAFRVK